MFEMKDDTSNLLFRMIDPWIVDALSEEEKGIAQGILMRALKESFDRRWLWGLGELGTDEAYEFVLDLYQKEPIDSMRVNYAYTLMWMNKDAPVLDYIQEVLKSSEPEDVKMRALSALYPLSDKEFQNEARHKIYLSILFDTMKDTSEGLRLFAYDMLKDHYGMKEFTPNDDKVVTILTSSKKVQDFDRATQLFRERVESIEVKPVSRKAIAQWVTERLHDPPSIEPEDCEICKKIPERSAADMTEGESLDSFTERLETAILFAYYKNRVMRCPVCGRLYLYRYEYEYLIPRSEEDEYLEKTDSDSMMAFIDSFLKAYDFKRIIICGNFMKVSY